MTAELPVDPVTLARVWVAMCAAGLGATVVMAILACWTE